MKFNNLFEFVVILNEMFDTKIAPNKWSYNGSNRIGHLIIDKEDYFIKLEPKIYVFENKEYSFINVAFSKLINGKETENLTYDNRSGSRVLGAIFHAVKDEIQKYETDAIVFVATDNVEKRMRIYNNLVSKLHPNFKDNITNIKIPNGKMTIIFNSNNKIIDHNKFIEFLKTQIKP